MAEIKTSDNTEHCEDIRIPLLFKLICLYDFKQYKVESTCDDIV